MSREALLVTASKRYIDVVCSVTGVTLEDLVSDKKGGQLVDARHLLMYVMWDDDYAAIDIANLMNRERNTVLYAADKMRVAVRFDPLVKRMYEDIIRLLKKGSAEEERDVMDILREANNIT